MGLYPEYYIHWQMDGLVSGGGGLKSGGGFKVGFYGISLVFEEKY